MAMKMIQRMKNTALCRVTQKHAVSVFVKLACFSGVTSGWSGSQRERMEIIRQFSIGQMPFMFCNYNVKELMGSQSSN